MADSLKRKFFSGIAWTFVQNIAVRALSVIFTIILARLLMPEDYGLIGMLSIFIAISDVFIQSGFGQALIQKSDCNDDDYSTAFYFNVVVSVLIYFVLFISAPLIASFYHEPQLVNITRVLSFNFILGSFNIVQQSKLRKSMNFRPLAFITLMCTAGSGGVGIILAYCGFGVWALVAQTLCATLVRVLLFPVYTRWTPNRPFSMASFRHLWGFGSKILVTGILDVIIINLSNILIGRFFNKDQVGYFSKARNFADVPAQTLSSVLGTVLFPLLSEIHDDEERHKAVYRKTCYYTVLITFPFMILMALLAKPIVIILFTNRWEACIPLFQAFLFARALLPLNIINSQMLQSGGDTKTYMNLYFVTGPLSIIAIIVSIPFGVQAMAWATLISGLFYYIFFAVVIGNKIGYSYIKQLWERRMIYLSLVFMTMGVYFCILLLKEMWLQLILGFLIGMLIYIICCKLFKIVDEGMLISLRDRLKFGKKNNKI